MSLDFTDAVALRILLSGNIYLASLSPFFSSIGFEMSPSGLYPIRAIAYCLSQFLNDLFALETSGYEADSCII